MHQRQRIRHLVYLVLMTLFLHPQNTIAQMSPAGAQSENEGARTLMEQGKQAFGQKDFPTAAALFRKAFLADKSLVLAQYNYAFALRKAGSYEAARDAYLEYVRLVPQDLDGLFGLAETERLLGNTKAAGSYFSDYLQKENRPGKESYVAYAQKFAQQKPQETPGGKEGILKRAEEKYQQKDYENAAELFRQAYALDAADTAVGLRYALSLRKAGLFDKAITAYSEIRKVAPKELDSLFGLAETYRLAKKNADALRHFEDYVRLEQRAERKSYISFAKKQIAALTPQDSTEKTAEELYLEGMTAYKAKDYPTAIGLFDLAINTDPAFFKALYRKALSLRKMKDYAGARQTYLLYLKNVPDDLDAIYGLATTEKLAENVPEARRYFKQYIELEKRPSEAKYVAKAKKYLAETEPQTDEAIPVEDKPETKPVVAQQEEPAPKPEPAAEPAAEPVDAKAEEAANVTDVKEPVEPEIPLELQAHGHEGPAQNHTSRLGQSLTAAKMIGIGEMMLETYNNPIGATQYLKLALAAEPNNQQAHLALGRTYLKQGRTAEAKESLLRARQVSVDNEFGKTAERLLENLSPTSVMTRTPTAKEEEKARKTYEEGLKALKGNEDQKAVLLLTESVGYDPYKAEPYLRLGDALRNTASLTRALAAYRRAATLAPESVLPLWELAQTYEKMGEVRTARHHYELVMRSKAADATSGLKREAWLKVEGAI